MERNAEPADLTEPVRAHQRDLIHVSSLREQTENILRSWFGEQPVPSPLNRPWAFLSHVYSIDWRAPLALQEHVG